MRFPSFFRLFPFLAASVAASAVYAQGEAGSSTEDGEIRFPRYPAASADGARIAFVHQGDLWVVSAEGGTPSRLTATPNRESNPVWSPDGNWIAFASSRDGNEDVYVLPATGGPVRRLTWDSAPDVPVDWTPDGGAILFQTRRFLREGWNETTFLVRVSGGVAAPLLPVTGAEGDVSPDGRRVLFTRGSMPWWRTGYEGPARLQLWMCWLPSPVTAEPLAVQAERGRKRRPAAPGEARPPKEPAAPWPPPVPKDPAVPMQPLPPDSLATYPALIADTSLLFPDGYTNLSTTEADAGEFRSRPAARGIVPDWNHPEQEWGANLNASWFPDNRRILYLSHLHDSANLKWMDIETGERGFVTRLVDARLRSPSLSANGELVVFELEDGMYAIDLPVDLHNPIPEPRKIRIEAPLDEPEPANVRIKVNDDSGEMALSPDGEQIAFVHHGDIFAMKVSEDEPWAYPVVESPFREGELAWTPDSEALVFVSDREGSKDLYCVRSSEPDEKRLARSLRFDVQRLTSHQADDRKPGVSPDGKRIAFVRGNGTLVTIAADGSSERVLQEGWSDLEFSWSPDSKWLALSREDADYNADVFVLAADGSTPPYNVSRHPDNDFNPVWSGDGKVLAFVSDRRYPSETDVWYVRLQRADERLSAEERFDHYSESRDGDSARREERDYAGTSVAAADVPGGATDAEKSSKKRDPGSKTAAKDGDEDDKGDKNDKDELPPEVKIDFENLHLRVQRLTSLPGRETSVLISRNAEWFVFATDTDGKRDLWKVRWDGDEENRLTEGGTDPAQVIWGPDEKRLFYRKSKGGFGSVSADGGDSESYEFEAESRIDRRAQREAVFAEAWRELGAHFYDSTMHGADWNRARERYGRWVSAVTTHHDFLDVLKMMLGEVQASHVNVSGGPGEVGWDLLAGPDSWIREEASAEGALAPADEPWGPEPRTDEAADGVGAQTGELGLFFDPGFAGPGLRVAHVVPRSPAAEADPPVREGETLLSIDGAPLGPDVEPAQILDRTVGRPVQLEIRAANGALRNLVVRPVTPAVLHGHIYDETIALRRAWVEKVSRGRVAYLHVRSMSAPSLEDFERDLHAIAHGKEALVIDVRDNGGGWTTDILLTSLTAPDHATTRARDGERGYPQDRRLFYAWTKPIAVLCNEFSYSNAEIFSWSIQATQRGPVVGEQTHGAVISTGGTFLGDGTWLRLPFRGWETHVDGSVMEDAGCPPDVRVLNDPGAIAVGRDPQLAAAVREALAQVRGQ